MKVKDLITKYQLQDGWKPEVFNDVYNEFASEFIALTEYYKADGNIKGLDQAIRVIKTKYESLSNKVRGLVSSNFWSKFDKEVIKSISEKLCSEQLAQRVQQEKWRKEREARRRAERERRQREWSGGFFDWERLAFLYLLLGDSAPTESFNLLGLPTTATSNEVKDAYRRLSLKCHPDRGGNQEEFVRITSAKNKALKWADDHNG